MTNDEVLVGIDKWLRKAIVLYMQVLIKKTQVIEDMLSFFTESE